MCFSYKVKRIRLLLYGSDRLVTRKENIRLFNNNYTGRPEESYAGWDINTKVYPANTNPFVSGRRLLGRKEYDLSDHLGNVTTQLSDRKTGTIATNDVQAQVLSYQQYFPFGWNMPGRSVNADRARFGFNDKELDLEWGIQDYGFRLYDNRVAKFLSFDPLAPDYPELTPYQFASNTPIQAIDLDGLEAYYLSDGTWGGQVGNNDAVIVIPAASAIAQNIQMQIAQANADPRYARLLRRQGTDLGMNHTQVQEFAGTLYAESSTSTYITTEEVAAIYSTIENRANVRRHSSYDEIRHIGNDGNYAIRGYGDYQENPIIVNASENRDVPSYVLNKMNTVREGLFQGIQSNQDFSNGAFFWDGTDFRTVPRYTEGYNFTDNSHDIWSLGDHLLPGSEYNAWNYKHESTGTEAQTTFSRLTADWRDAQLPGNNSTNELGYAK